MQDQMQPQDTPQGLPNGEVDHEGAMAKADLHKLANYSIKLFKQIEDNQQLEGWVQAKITKAADYIASVYHYLEYEMKFSEYGDHLANAEVYSESQKAALTNMLMEAKAKMKELKKKQVEKVKEKQMDEGVLSGGHKTCDACGGSGSVYEEPKEVPAHVKSKVEKYKRLTKATHAAHKRMDANKNGIPDEDELNELTAEYPGGSTNFSTGEVKGTYTPEKEVDEETSSTGGEITRGKGFTRHSHNPARFTDEPHAEVPSKAKSKSAAEKSGEKAADKQTEKDSKDWAKRFGKDSVTKVSAGKKVDPSAKKEKEVDETYGQGVYEAKGKKPDFLDMDKDGNKKESMKKAVADKKKNPFAKKVDEAKKELKGNQKKLDVDHDGDIEADDLADLRAGKKEKKVDEASKPSAGMSKGEKSAVVKKAKAGGDIGKPGKSFDKVAKAAGGGKKGEKIAAAAMWKNAAKNESVELQPVVIAESAEMTRMKELLTRLNG